LTQKAAWWAGYRAGKGLPEDTPRKDAIVMSVPQDVEEFIAEKAHEGDGHNAPPLFVVADDIREWMTGHARVKIPEKTFGEGIDVSYHDLFSKWQADHEANRNASMSAPSQDVEAWIAEKKYYTTIANLEEMDGTESVSVAELREFLGARMAGHVRVSRSDLCSLYDLVREELFGMALTAIDAMLTASRRTSND
jgi:hypothetical protein